MRNLRNRLERLFRRLPRTLDPDAPLTAGDLQFLENLDHVYGDGDPPDWREQYPRRADLDREFENALASAYSSGWGASAGEEKEAGNPNPDEWGTPPSEGLNHALCRFTGKSWSLLLPENNFNI